MAEYWEINRANWDQRAEVHATSSTYDLRRLVEDPTALSDVVSHDAPFLGDLTGLDVCHLQCHIGSDTVSLAKLGARSISGLDVSPKSLEVARRLAQDCGIADATFVEAEVYDAVEALGADRFDLVYSGVGAINWIPSIARWAKVVAALVRPGGRIYLRDCHPMLFTIDHRRDDRALVAEFAYFETDEPFVDDEPGTYTDGDHTSITSTLTHEWNHGLGETVQALIDAGLVIARLAEHTTAEWQALPSMVDVGGGQFALPERPERLPMMFTVEARKP
jgi:2-polyprenyl-3-methyl-5-hydroxy-6-metoxy-1,4-benzoquinol methylase